jgi:dihydroxyacetone kinase-like predicted kinase
VPTWTPSRSVLSWWTVLTPAAGDDLTVTTACVTSKYGDEKSTAASIDENGERLRSSLEGIRAGSVAPAARDDTKGRFVKGDAVGFVEDEIVAWGGAGSTLDETMSRLGEGAEILTVVGGEGAPIALGDLDGHAPDGVELELHEGGQPHYWWLLAAQ